MASFIDSALTWIDTSKAGQCFADLGSKLDLLPQQTANGLMLGGVYVMVAVSFTLIIGMLNFLNFTVPALFMVAAVLMWASLSGGFGSGVDQVLSAIVGSGNKWILGIVIALAAVALCSLVIERFTYRYMKARYGDATEHALPLVSSLGFLIIFEHVVITIWGSDALTTTSPFGTSSFFVGSIQFSTPQVISLLVSLGFVFGLSYLLKSTRLGRALRSIAEKPDTAPLMGVEVGRIVPVVYVFAGLLSGIAGVLFTLNYTTVDAYVGDTVATVAIAGMVLGGLGNVWGAVVGGLIVALLQIYATHFCGADVVKIPVWGLLLLVLIFKPTGLFGHAAVGKGKF